MIESKALLTVVISSSKCVAYCRFMSKCRVRDGSTSQLESLAFRKYDIHNCG